MDDKQPVIDLSATEPAVDSQMGLLPQDLETINLFMGMDNISWTNPVCFDGFPEFDELYNTF
jgi:hypothetical protein